MTLDGKVNRVKACLGKSQPRETCHIEVLTWENDQKLKSVPCSVKQRHMTAVQSKAKIRGDSSEFVCFDLPC